MEKYVKWFCRAMWVGIIADWIICIPTIFAPEWVLTTLDMRHTLDPTWTAFAALLVFLLSLSYIPGARDPYRYRWTAWLSVLARPPGVIFFLIYMPELYPAFGYLDLILFFTQFPLLLLAYKSFPKQDWVFPNDSPQYPINDQSQLWFKRVVWAGIIADLILGIPAIFAPEIVLNLLGMRPTEDPVWTAFAAMILVLLGISYIPGANSPYRYRSIAWFSVLARPPGVIFFLYLYQDTYPAFGYLDLALFSVQFPLLIKVMQLRPELGTEQDLDVFEYHGTTYQYVKDAAWSGPYEQLPTHKGLRPGKFIQFLNDSARNMHDRRDIRPKYDKLIHSHGICFAGTWRIDQNSPYTGYFKKGSEGLLIARGSVAGPLTKRGFLRSFGFGGKIFPTLRTDEWVWPANFVTVSHLSGSKATHITDIEMTNSPSVGYDPIANIINRVIFRFMDTRPGYRQLYPISTLGLQPNEKAITPDLMMLKVNDRMPKIDKADFRDELRLINYPDQKLIYDIYVKNFDEQDWQRLGVIEFTEDTISEGSDKRIHFWIPKDIPTQRH